MNSSEKVSLLEGLDKAYLTIQATLEGIDLEMGVYTDSDWRVSDILGHITTWDREVTKSLRAFLAGTQYIIPDLDDDEIDFNQQAVLSQRELTTQELMNEWERARDDFKAAISEIPLERFPGDMVYPWGNENGSIATLVSYMIDHDEEHRLEVLKAIQPNQAD
jgi:hypothetical protein